MIDLPGGNRGPTTIYAYPGSTVTLLAFTNFSSNPDPFISRWLNNSGLPIDPSTDARMTEVSTTTKSLTISSVTTNDHGQWSFGAVNTIGSGSIAIDLYIASKIQSKVLQVILLIAFRASWSCVKLNEYHFQRHRSLTCMDSSYIAWSASVF